MSSNIRENRRRRVIGASVALGLGLFSIVPLATSAVAAPGDPGSISGKITVDTASRGLQAQAWKEAGVDGWTPVGAPAVADVAGNYTIAGLPAGSYKVGFGDYASGTGFAPEYYNDKLSAFDADPVVVAGGVTTANINSTLTYAGPVPTSRLAGATRYHNSALVAAEFAAFDAGTGVVYVASGEKFPDALSAGPAAAYQGGPVLLTLPGELPAVVKEQITRRAPDRIVLVGGTDSVSESVFTELGTLAPNVERLAGQDRYDTSRLVAETVFPDSPAAFIATGENFPDALSASGAAARLSAPVILVPGSAAAVNKGTTDLLTKLVVKDVYIAGGPNTVTPGIQTSLSDAGFTVQRLSGADRYEASIAINSQFDGAGTVYLAVGNVFPDALGGGALAGLNSAPLYVVPGNCVPIALLKNIAYLGATEVVLLSGPARLTAAVESLTHC